MSTKTTHSTQGKPSNIKDDGCTKHVCCGEPPGEIADGNLEEIVDRYEKCSRHYHAVDIADFSSEDFSEVVERATLGKMSNDNTHPHQYRPGGKILKKGHSQLQHREDDLLAAESFEELFEIVNNTIGPIWGIGEMVVYDTTLRIGAHRGKYPEQVYLHRGARDGARKLGLANTTTKFLPVSRFPKPLQRLEPHEIEDCLCIFKNSFRANWQDG